MRALIAASVALGIASVCIAPVRAQVVVRTPQVAPPPPPPDAAPPPPGVTIETPYWRDNPNDHWKARRQFSGEQYAHEEWLRSHCVRDWSGAEYCRR
jgi:hypothetical protein